MKVRIYDHECPKCGHLHRDTMVLTRCLQCKKGEYDIVAEYPGGV